jgi:hypothetical protein
MKYIIILLLILITNNTLLGQNNTCQTATPYVDDIFVFYNPPTNWVELYRVFQVSSTEVDFSFTPFSANVGGNNVCPVINTQYLLYDNNCVLLDANSIGLFTNLVPGNSYILGYIANCTQPGIGFVLTGEDISLPIELLYFTALSNKKTVDILWASGSEFNCAGFSIERSTDAYNWVDLGFIEGAGNSQQVIKYQFEDENPIHGVNYYRLIQYDIDGDFEILQTIAIMWDKEIQNGPFRTYNFLGQKVN